MQAATEKDADVCVTGIVGCAGLLPTVEAIKAKKTIALANKETLISGGPAILPLLKEHGVNVIPADSEHSAIFQSLQVRASAVGMRRSSIATCHRACRDGRVDITLHQITVCSHTHGPAHWARTHVVCRLPCMAQPLFTPQSTTPHIPMQGVPPGGLRRIILTASGGAFRDWAVEDLKKVTVADALKASPSPSPPAPLRARSCLC